MLYESDTDNERLRKLISVSIPRNASKVMLIYSMIGKDASLVDEAEGSLHKQFGETCRKSDLLAFDRTNYYEEEMGGNLVRRFIAFSDLIDPRRLAGIKLWSNEVEKAFAEDGKRKINFDPGYISLERLILATGKNFTHRVYLDHGIYADLTLIYYHKSFRPLQWTYPDYADETVIDFMNSVRVEYMTRLRESELN